MLYRSIENLLRKIRESNGRCHAAGADRGTRLDLRIQDRVDEAFRKTGGRSCIWPSLHAEEAGLQEAIQGGMLRRALVLREGVR